MTWLLEDALYISLLCNSSRAAYYNKSVLSDFCIIKLPAFFLSPSFLMLHFHTLFSTDAPKTVWCEVRHTADQGLLSSLKLIIYKLV